MSKQIQDTVPFDSKSIMLSHHWKTSILLIICFSAMHCTQGISLVSASSICVDDSNLIFNMKGKNRSCHWISKKKKKKKKKKRCKKKSAEGDKLKTLCPSACNNCPESTTDSPTETPPVITNGCCSLDLKNCIDWCGSTIDSCLSCISNDGVIWLTDGSTSDTECVKRWSECNNSNDCCDGLTCRLRGDTMYSYMACLKPRALTPTRDPSSSQNEIEWDGNDLVLTHYWDCR